MKNKTKIVQVKPKRGSVTLYLSDEVIEGVSKRAEKEDRSLSKMADILLAKALA